MTYPHLESAKPHLVAENALGARGSNESLPPHRLISPRATSAAAGVGARVGNDERGNAFFALLLAEAEILSDTTDPCTDGNTLRLVTVLHLGPLTDIELAAQCAGIDVELGTIGIHEQD